MGKRRPCKTNKDSKRNIRVSRCRPGSEEDPRAPEAVAKNARLAGLGNFLDFIAVARAGVHDAAAPSPLPSPPLSVPFYLFLVDLRLLYFCCAGNRRIRAVQLHPMHFDALRMSLPRRGKTMGRICRGLNSTISRFIPMYAARGDSFEFC